MYRPCASSPILLNPAYCGKATTPSSTYARLLAGVHSNRFLGESTGFLTYDQYLDKLGGGIGITAEQYHIGNDAISSWSVKGAYNYILPISKKLWASMALQAGMESRKLQANKLAGIPKTDIGFIDPSLADSGILAMQVNKQRNYATLGAGILLQGRNFELGFSALDIGRPDWNVITGISRKKPMTINAHGLLSIMSLEDDKARIYLKGLYTKVGTDHMLHGGLQLKSKKLMAGLAYNNYYNDTISLGFIMGSVGITIDDIGFRYNIEYQVSKALAPMVNHTFSLIFFIHTRGREMKLMSQPYKDLTF